MADYSFTHRPTVLPGVLRVRAGGGAIFAIDCQGQDADDIELYDTFVKGYCSRDEGASFQEVTVGQWVGHLYARLYGFAYSAGFFRVAVYIRSAGEGGSNRLVQYQSPDGVNWTMSQMNTAGFGEPSKVVFLDGKILALANSGNSDFVSYDDGVSFAPIESFPGKSRLRCFMYETANSGYAIGTGGLVVDKATGAFSLPDDLQLFGRSGFYDQPNDQIYTNDMYLIRGKSYVEDIYYFGQFCAIQKVGQSDHFLQVVGDGGGNYGLLRFNNQRLDRVAGAEVNYYVLEEIFNVGEVVFDGGIEPSPSFGPITSPSCDFIDSICLGGDRHLICMADPYDAGVGSMRFVFAEPDEEVIKPFIPFWTNKVGTYEQQTENLG